ncbi:hypothetical protein GE061_010363 [Apolygus lucorum]|uniref:Uncharacterized protein n=1 Tax=Apolygus lucorum TaxID=248454 RepID=A0A8S9Y304_APOLU|nr:hypothetical protein GE061_010363 [Apolygus lucorum]
MVLDTSKTGLMPIVPEYSRDIANKQTLPTLEFQKCIQPAPLAVKPFSSLLNPFRKGCSIFCNHPTADTNLKNMIKKSKMKKDEEREEIGVDKKALADRVGEVLEEMLCRYKRYPEDDETSSAEDSITQQPQSRPVLVLDLMRAASQETMSTTMGGRGTGLQSSYMSPASSPVPVNNKTIINKLPMTPPSDTSFNKLETEGDTATEGGVEDDGDVQKRRGKIKKKKKKGGATSNLDEKSSKEVIGLMEPGETQLFAVRILALKYCEKCATVRDNCAKLLNGLSLYHLPSELVMISIQYLTSYLNHGKLQPRRTISTWKEGDDLSWRGSSNNATPQPTSLDPPDTDSALHLSSDIFDDPTLLHLRRSLTLQQAEGEFRRIVRRYWRNVLLEALAASDKPPEVEPAVVKQDLIFKPSDPELWKNYPREFKYSSARFDIPISKATLNGMSSLDYLKNYVVVAKEYRLLYNHVFMQYREIPNDDPPWYMLGKNVLDALAQVMGRQFDTNEASELRFLVDWRDGDRIDLRTWIGIGALTERIFGLRFTTAADPDLGERQVIEVVDFEAFNEKKHLLKLNIQLKSLLEAVQNVQRRRENKLLKDLPDDETQEIVRFLIRHKK